MPEAVDRLELVADEEELLRVELVDDLALEAVRVLEFVDHDRAEAKTLAPADVVVSRQEIARAQLEVFEVQRALGVLRALIRAAVELEELLEQVAVAHGGDVQRRLLEREPRILVGGEPLLAAALHRKDGQVEEEIHGRRAVEQLESARHLSPAHVGLLTTLGLGERGGRRIAQLREACLEVGLLLQA